MGACFVILVAIDLYPVERYHSKMRFLPSAGMICLALFTGCTSDSVPSQRLETISIGMTRQEVVERLGQPRVVRGSIQNKHGQVVEIYEYRFTMPVDDGRGMKVSKRVFTVATVGLGALVLDGESREYWLYFHDSRLVQWGEAGDWTREADRIYQFKFGADHLVEPEGKVPVTK